MEERQQIDIAEQLKEAKYEPKPINRITYSITFTYENESDRPTQIYIPSSEQLELDGVQPLERYVTIEDKWEPLDLAWYKRTEMGLIIFENITRIAQFTNPTEEQIEDNKKQLLLIALGSTDEVDLIVRPRRPQVIELYQGREIWLKAADKPVKVHYMIMPR